MRIGIDARLNAYREGGIAEYTRRLIESLAPLDSGNAYRVIHHARGAALLPANAPNFRRVRLFTPPHHRFERIALSVEIAPLGLDLLHSPDFIPPAFGARRYLITVHDLTFLHYPEFQTAESRAYYNGHIRRAVQQAAHILADSEATRADLCDLLGVPPAKVTVHLLGVSEVYRPLTPEAIQPTLARLGLPQGGYFLFVGTFEPRKNLPGLLAAYALLRARCPDVPPLVIAGRRGWLYETIFQNAQALGLGKSAIWIENPSFSDMPALYNGAVALVLPSHYEGFGFPPLEAMACGVPTVVSDRGSLPEVVGDTGLLIDPDDPESQAEAMCRALTDSAFRARSREAGLARASGFTWERTAEIVHSTYLRVLS
jgi:glycosyltransferase involved in cell wall biosynthesis